MARHLCIVARENSPLYGYLTIAFRERPPGAPTLDIVLDRRQANVPVAGVADRRQHSALDEAVRERGYAIFTGAGGGAPSLQDEAFIERAIGLLADVERRGPLAIRFNARRRRALISAAGRGVITVLVLILVTASILRLGGLGRIADTATALAEDTVTRLEGAWLSLRGQAEPGDPRPAAAAAASSPKPAARAPEARAIDPAPPSAEPSLAPAPALAPRAAMTPPSPTRAPTADASAAPAPAPSRDVAALESRPLPAFTGLLPRVDMSREAGASDHGVVYVLRVTDSGGQPISGAQVWLRGQGADGKTREVQLDEGDGPGLYRSGSLPPDLLPPSLNARLHFSNMRLEIPLDR
ncbi:MAG TPA: hypothetical protein VL948_12795 [Verrucomicrobiae bacterium]|jgi:hypothetical protein|nr:hypothetical protein [Verrucomicrobiae bacterium]